ncbi:hypothetical protein HKD37_05G013198 [Glycine soja]
MDPNIVNTAITSRRRKREEYKKIILLVAACVVHMELERRNFLNHLYRGTEKDCIEKLRLSKNAFFNLCRILEEKGGLVRTRNVPTTEVVAMFLHILAHNLKYRVVQFSCCRSKETKNRQFNDVLRAVIKVSKNYLNFQPYTLEGAEANKWRWFEENDITTIQATEEWTGFRDTLAMNMFANYQRNQRNLDNKGDGGWERSALNVAAAMLSTSFNIISKTSNYEDCGMSGFDWDDTKYMFTVENENAWNEYCTTNIGEKEGITVSLDRMTNSFDRMVEEMDGKVDDEDIQGVFT